MSALSRISGRKSSLEQEIGQASGLVKLKSILDPASIATDLSKDARNALFKKMWNEDLIPNWASEKNSKKTRRALWYGIPSSIRGQVWQLIIGNECKITKELFAILCARGKDLATEQQSKRSSSPGVTHEEKNEEKTNSDKSVHLIMLDLPRTFPDLMFFHEEGPLRDPLKELLCAYVAYRPDVGYVQGMSYLAAMLLLNLSSVEEAFIAFANILNEELYFSLYRMELKTMQKHVEMYNEIFEKQLPKLFKKFHELGINADMYLYEWMITIFSRSLSLDVASRIWDNFLWHGPVFIFRAALGLVRSFQDTFLSEAAGFEEILSTLNRPKDIEEDNLFDNIEKISISEKDFTELTAKHFEEVDLIQYS
eukprot:TRINITY_DN16931_c0_g1_i2.p1 TRINITY_DN16931_c0_g1~~TRINITY_DN16931_c0_g1_i2.p1  ORF type:complete len:381 (-),score=97.08 TRINITY_DN16931_c0_g1_i2:33-1133(-)